MQYRAFLAHKRQLEDKKIDQLVAGATLLLRGKGMDNARVKGVTTSRSAARLSAAGRAGREM